MQQTHAVFGELAHYGSEPFNYSYVSIGLTNDFVPLVKVTVNVMPHYHNMDRRIVEDLIERGYHDSWKFDRL